MPSPIRSLFRRYAPVRKPARVVVLGTRLESLEDRSTPSASFAVAPAFNAGIASPNGLSWTLAKGDFNGDDQQDFVAHGGFGVNQFDVYLNQGGGSFTPVTAPNIPDSVQTDSLVVADFFGPTGTGAPDGFDDIAFIDATLNTIDVLASQGDGTFFPVSTTPINFTRISMAAGDLTGDGKPDLFLGRFGGGGPGGTFGEYEVQVNNGNGTFTAIDRTGTNGLSWISAQPVIADIDGDGKMDVVANSLFPVNGTGLAGVYYGNGDGTFTRTSKLLLPGNLQTDDLAVGDFDGNGRPDVAIVAGSTFYVYYQSAAAVFPTNPTTLFTTSASPTDLAVGDFDYNGRADIAITPFSAIDPSVRVYEGQANQSFISGGGIAFATAGTNTPIITIDGDQNGTPDLLVGTFTSGNVAKYQYLQNQNLPPTPVTSVVSLTATPNPAAYAAAVTLTTKITRLGNIPTGSVTFFNGTTILGSSPLDPTGKASISVSTLPVGTTVVQAVYSGNSDYTGGTSPARSIVVNPIVAPTSVSFTTQFGGPPFFSIFGQSADFTATITPVTGAMPTGTFQFFAGTATIPFGSAMVDATGTALLSTSLAPFGTYKIRADYSADPLYANGTATSVDDLQVIKLPTQTELIVSSNPSVYGQPLSYTINVSTTLPSSFGLTPVYSGPVSIFDNSNVIAVVNVDSNGTAMFNLPSNYAIGTHTVSASYTGTSSISGSNSPLFDVVITKAPTAATLVVTPSPATFGDTLVLTSTVSVTVPGATAPVGSVVFTQDGKSIGSAAIDTNGVARFLVAGLAAGSYTFTASYLGNSGADAADATPVTVAISKSTSITDLIVTPTAATFGAPVVLTASVADSRGRGVNVGTVTFTGSANGTPLILAANVNVVNGIASTTVNGLPIGSATFNVSFSGDTSINGSTNNAPMTITIAKAVGALGIKSTGGLSTPFGKKVTFTATFLRPSGLTVVAGGSVTFKDNGTALATVALNSTGTAAYTGEFSRGDHSITAEYSGDPNFFPTTASLGFDVFRPTDAFTAGAGTGGFDRVKVYNADGSVRFSPLFAFGPDHTAGVRVATADFDRDGVQDFVVGTGPGVGSRVRILNGIDGSPLFDFSPFGPEYLGGVYVAAGDVTGDGKPDLVVTPDRGGGARIRVINGTNYKQIADFFGLIDGNGNADENFRGGSRAAIGDVNGDGFGDIVFAAGFGGGPRIAIFNGKALTSKGGPKLTADFFAFDEKLRNGSFVAVGDTNGDGFADVIAGAGPGGGPRVTVYSGKALLSNSRTLLADFFAGDETSRTGVPVAARYLDSDELLDIVAGSGTGSTKVTTYLGKNLKPNGFPTPTLSFVAFADTGVDADATRGVFVG